MNKEEQLVSIIKNRSVFDFSFENSFTVGFKYNKLPIWDEDSNNDVTENDTENDTEKLNRIELSIISLLLKDDSMTYSSIASTIGVARITVARYFTSLTKKGLVKRVGGDKGGHWEIINRKGNNN